MASARESLGVEGDCPYEATSGRSRKASEAELKGVEGGVCVGIESEGWWAERNTIRRVETSLRIGVHHADAVVWGPVIRRAGTGVMR